MNTEIWIPGTNKKLDRLFDLLRSQQHTNTAHDLHKNYAAEHFSCCVALSITFDNGPQFCGSIINKTCWPTGVYRIINRFWKVNPVDHALAHATPSSGFLIREQLQWVYTNTDCHLCFISRQSNYWQQWAVEQLKNFELDFKYNQHRYLTCDNDLDEACWQKIIYHGDEKLLDTWRHR